MNNEEIVLGYYISNNDFRKINNFDFENSMNDDEFIWLHLDGKKNETKEWLSNNSSIPKIMCESLISQDTRPRLVNLKDSLLINLRGLNLNPNCDTEDMVSLHMWISPKRIITIRNEKVLTINEIKTEIELGIGPKTLVNFLKRVIEGLTTKISDYISELGNKVDELEDNVLISETKELKSSLLQIRRKILMIRRYIVPQRDVLSMLHIEGIDWMSELDRFYIREFSEKTTRLIDELDTIRDRAQITQEELNAKVSDQMNKTMYILSIVSSIFLPISFLTGLFGINIAGMPGTNNSYAFLVFSIIMLIIACFEFLILKKNRWL